MVRAEPKAKAQKEKIFKTGVQVEWIECESFLQWQLHVQTSRVQVECMDRSRPFVASDIDL